MTYKKILAVIMSAVISFSIAGPVLTATSNNTSQQSGIRRSGSQSGRLIMQVIMEGNGKLTLTQFLVKIKAVYKANKAALGNMTEAEFIQLATDMFQRFQSGGFRNRNSGGGTSGNNSRPAQSNNGGSSGRTPNKPAAQNNTVKPNNQANSTQNTNASAKKPASTNQAKPSAASSVNTSAPLPKTNNLNKYMQHINRVKGLGIIYNSMSNTGAVSRDEFSKIMVIASGNEDAARSAKKTKNFSDVSAGSTSNLFISMAVSKGFISGMADGKFHPKDTVTFAQSCTAAVRALGYTDQDVTGIWPKNYIDKAKSLGLTDDLNLSASSGMTVWALATIIDNMLDTQVKGNGQGDQGEASKSFIDASGLSRESYIFGHILNPIYSKPVIANGIKPGTKKIGSITLSGKKIVRNGEVVAASEILYYDVVYSVSDKWKERSYILVIDNKVNGALSNITPNRVSPKTIQIDDKSYNVSKDMNISTITSSSKLKAGSSVTALLGYDGKIVCILTGLLTQITIYDDSRTNSRLDTNEILTDKGTFSISKGMELSVGCKYDVAIDGTIIEKANKKINNVKSAVIEKVVESSITANTGSKVEKLILNDKIPYYYNGQKVNYENVPNILAPFYTIYFAYGINGANYDYAVITGPEYSKPTVISSATKIPGNKKIVRNGEYIKPNQVLKTEVMYTVSDRNKKGTQLVIIDNKVSGVLNKLSPNRTSPQSMTIGGKDYPVSRDMNIKSLADKNSKIKVGYNVTALLGYDDRIVDLLYGQYGQIIIEGDENSSNKVAKEQILTDKGVLSISSIKQKFNIGCKYHVSIDGSNVVDMYDKSNNAKSLVVDSVVDSVITAQNNGKLENPDFPEDIAYYYNGEKIGYDKIYESMQTYSTVTFGYNDENTGYEYAIISNPLYSKPFSLSALQSSNLRIIKNGEIVSKDKLAPTDVIYTVSDISGRYRYILALDNKISGVLTGISPSSVNPKSLQISNKDYEISKDADIAKIIKNSDALKLNNNITVVLGYDGKILSIIPGQYTTVTIVSDAQTDSTLGYNQVQTDNGIYSVSGGVTFKKGCKYDVIVDGTRITSIYNQVNTATDIIVDSVIDSVAYTINNGSKEKIDISDRFNYYYGSKKLGASDVIKILKRYSTISFGYNTSKTDFDYAVISDPVYSKPQIVSGYTLGSSMIGNIDLSNALFIVKDGDIITADKIQNNDVVYSVSDINFTRKYIQVVDDKVGGTITAILPDRNSPTSIRIDDKEYAVSRDFNGARLAGDNSILKVDNSATVVLGYDGKIVDVLSGYYIDCVVIGTSTTNSNLASGQVMTDKGIFSLPVGVSMDYGCKYSVATSGTKITSIVSRLNDSTDILVNSFSGTTITTSSGSMTLSDQIPYYYNGQKQNYTSLGNVIKQYSLITFGYNKDKTDYAYAVISDPVYSTPFIYGFDQGIVIDGSVPIIKNGAVVSPSSVQFFDIVYNVYDIRSRKTHVVVVSNKVSGTITSVSPDLFNPTTIQVGGKTYDISKASNRGLVYMYISNSSISIPVTLLLGINGEVIYIYVCTISNVF